MALTDNTTNYGIDTDGFFSKALLTGNSVDQFDKYISENDKIKIASLDLLNTVQDFSCSWAPAGTTTLAQKTITTCNKMVQLDFCLDEWNANYLAAKLNGNDIPPTVEAYLVGQIGLAINAWMEYGVWQNSTAASPADCFDGIIKLGTDDATVVDVVGTTLSASNIITELDKVVAAIPATVRFNGKVKIFLSPTAAAFFKSKVASTSLYAKADPELIYLGIPLVVTNGMPTNKMVAADPKNFAVGVKSWNDDSIKVVSLLETLAIDSVRIFAKFAVGIQIKVGAEVVLYQ